MTNRMRLWGNKLAGGGGAGATGLGIMAASAGTGAAHMMGVDPYTAMAIGGAVGTGVGKAGTTHRRCPTSRDFVPWRFSDAGRRSAWIASSCRHPKTCTIGDIDERILTAGGVIDSARTAPVTTTILFVKWPSVSATITK